VKQIQCLHKIYENNVCLPTGCGKSLVYDIYLLWLLLDLRVIVNTVLSRRAELVYEVMKGAVSDARFIEGDF
jgi:hypothetical protein